MLATVGMAACSKDDTAPAADPKKYVQVTIPEDMVSGETRTSIDGTTTNWVAGDKVAVLLYDGAATAFFVFCDTERKYRKMHTDE